MEIFLLLHIEDLLVEKEKDSFKFKSRGEYSHKENETLVEENNEFLSNV